MDIATQRLARQHLARPASDSPADVVRRLGAVQAQDYGGAKWGLGQRVAGATDASVERAIDAGEIIRTHVLRPTWHFVTREDVRWMLALTAPRIRAGMAYHDRRLELTEAMLGRSNDALAGALQGGQHLTRAELSKVLERAKTGLTGAQRLGHLMLRAELDGVVCSGARRGNQFTYALFDERVPPTQALARDEAIAELTKRFFSTRGPATAQDFAWWSGLTVADAKRGIETLGPLLENEMRDGRAHWWLGPTPRRRSSAPLAHLLPNYDEYFIGYKDRSAIGEIVKGYKPDNTHPVLATHLAFVDGQIVGGWKRTVTAKGVTVDVRLLARVTSVQRTALTKAAQSYAKFVEQPLVAAAVSAAR